MKTTAEGSERRGAQEIKSRRRAGRAEFRRWKRWEHPRDHEGTVAMEERQADDLRDGRESCSRYKTSVRSPSSANRSKKGA